MAMQPDGGGSTSVSPFLRRSVLDDVHAERVRAHEKHGATSMESLPVTDMTRLSVLMEEVGEVAREFNEARHRTHRSILPQRERQAAVDMGALRKELIQVAAMAAAWADALAGCEVCGSVTVGHLRDHRCRHDGCQIGTGGASFCYVHADIP